jgi:hypothetical protein
MDTRDSIVSELKNLGYDNKKIELAITLFDLKDLVTTRRLMTESRDGWRHMFIPSSSHSRCKICKGDEDRHIGD